MGNAHIDPVAFTIGPLVVRWYGLAMAASILVGIMYLINKGRTRGLKEEQLLTMALLTVVGGVVGARLVFVAANYPSWFLENPVEVLRVDHGGLAWHGGLAGGVLTALWYLRYRIRVSFNLVADLCVPGIALGYTLIRFANIVNQENIGRLTQWDFGRWPAQLIAACIAIFMLIRFFYLENKPYPVGYQFWSFVFYHQILRGGVEETIREMPIVIPLFVSHEWGLGALTMVQVTTPPILLFVWWILRYRLEPPLNTGKSKKKISRKEK